MSDLSQFIDENCKGRRFYSVAQEEMKDVEYVYYLVKP